LIQDKYGIDNHKLIYHPCKVSDWLNGEDIYPILINVCPIGKCNHRCIFCSYNYTGYNRDTLDTKKFKNTLDELSNLGIKAVNYNNEGEPLLHPNIAEIVKYTRKVGIDVSIETNGVLLNKNLQETLTNNLSYIKISVDAGTPETHYKLHRGKKEDFNIVIQNIKDVCKIKRDCVVGIQMLLLKENEDEIQTLLNVLDGVDYDWFAIKPFSVNPYQDYHLVKPGDLEKAKKIPGVIVREYGFEREKLLSTKGKDYDICYGINFFSNIDCNGDVTICNALVGSKKFIIGNIYENSFESIWKNRRIKEQKTDVCSHYSCRLDKQNVYLWKLKNPHKHVNFI